MKKFLFFISAVLMIVLSIIFLMPLKHAEPILPPEPIEPAVIYELPSDDIVRALISNPSPPRALLKIAYAQGRKDGHENPTMIQGIILQESKAGMADGYRVSCSAADRCYGLGQIKVVAAREVMRAYPALWKKYKFHTKTDDEIIAHLILNDMFNIEVTSKYLKILNKRYGFTDRELINAYNRGPTGVKLIDNENFHYALAVEDKIASLKGK